MSLAKRVAETLAWHTTPWSHLKWKKQILSHTLHTYIIDSSGIFQGQPRFSFILLFNRMQSSIFILSKRICFVVYGSENLTTVGCCCAVASISLRNPCRLSDPPLCFTSRALGVQVRVTVPGLCYSSKNSIQFIVHTYLHKYKRYEDCDVSLLRIWKLSVVLVLAPFIQCCSIINIS